MPKPQTQRYYREEKILTECQICQGTGTISERQTHTHHENVTCWKCNGKRQYHVIRLVDCTPYIKRILKGHRRKSKKTPQKV